MNVSSVKNLNGEVFSAVQDASLTNVVQTNSGNWQDITAYQNASGTYLTAVDLSPYATTAEVDTLSSMLSGAIDYVSANAGDEFPVSADEAIQYVQTNSAQIDETVTSFQTNSSTYMVESNLEYNAVNEISGYNGSAIAQYGAEKQWLVHDDTLVHAANSAQYALGVNLSAVAQLLGVDETVLFSGTGATGAFSEPLSAFKKIEFHLSDDTMIRQVAILYPDDALNGAYIVGAASVWQPNTAPVRVLSVSGNMNEFSRTNAAYQWWSKNDGGFAQFSTTPVKVVGIGRKQ